LAEPTKTPPARAPSPAPPVVVDATGLVLGRAAGVIAKRLLSGQQIVVVHAEKAVVSGSRASVLESFRAARARGSVRSGPHYPRYPDRIFRRAVRGMLPHLKTRGKQAFRRLKVHIGCPSELSGASLESVPGARPRPGLRTPLTLEEISRLLGAHL
jgi:large subunit ribosomal protein L13